MGRNFYFQPGLSFTAKGSKLSGSRVDMTMNALYLQVPIYFAYKLSMYSWENSLNIAMGPYVAYGVGGKITGNGVYDINTFGDEGLANRPDVGFGMELQFEMPKVVFFSGFEGGFARVMKREYFSSSFQNFNTYFGIGYKF